MEGVVILTSEGANSIGGSRSFLRVKSDCGVHSPPVLFSPNASDKTLR